MLSPFALAMAYFSIPQTVIPFQLNSRSFVVTILVIMAAIWVLFFMQSVLLRQPLRKGITKWVNTIQLTETAKVYGDKFGLRRRHNYPNRSTNDVEMGIDVA
jgi:hypothetical protein